MTPRPPALPAAVLALLVLGPIAPAGPLAGPGNYELHPALDLALFAAEPDILDPVALAFDEFGRAYVVEMRDYPYGFGPERRPGATVRLLEDRDGDGRADRSTVFARDLSFPTSIAVWNGGVLVTAPPEIVFLKDTDGDGRADLREVVLAGFRLGVTDSNLNGLRWGLDNWLHAGNGGNGGSVYSPKTPSTRVDLGERDFRFRPASGEVELTAHTGGGFGLVFDSWGRSFVPHNVDHIKQRVADADYFAGVAGFPPVETTHSISDHGEMARIYAISAAQTRPNHPEQAGFFSSSGGMGFLGHRGWPADLQAASLVCDVVGNLVHRDRLVPDGPILRATRAPGEETREFFASRDPAFRPVGLEPGPDGALYLLDMQREVIEHPDYIPKKLLEKLDLRAGDDRGRIYRLFPKGWPARRELPGRATPAELVAFLDSPNPWTRETAQRLLVERRETSVVPGLREKLRRGPEPTGRLHALWTLDGLGALAEEDVVAALEDSAAPLRANALVLAESRAKTWVAAAVRIEALLGDPEAEVRFHAALAARALDPVPAFALVGLLKRDHAYAWSRRAALSSLGPYTHRVHGALLGDGGFWSSNTPAQRELAMEFADLLGASPPPAPLTNDPSSWCPDGDPAPGGSPPDFTLPALGRLPETLRVAVLEGLARGLARRERPPTGVLRPGAFRELTSLIDSWPPPDLLAAAWRVAARIGLPPTESQPKQLAFWLGRATNATLALEERTRIVRFLGVGDLPTVGPTVLRLLSGSEPTPIQQAALEVLRDHREPAVGRGLVEAWPSLSPTLRPAVVNLLVYRSSFHEALLAGLESGRLQVGELNLDLEHRRQLLRKASPDIRARAARFTSDEEYANRNAVVDRWLAELPAEGDALRGRAVFERLCAQCHRSGRLGFDVGPDLGGLSHRSVEDLLSNILDPNMAMNPAYVAYTAELTDGEQESGILAGETAGSVTLLQAQGRKVEIPRRDLRQFRSNGRSLMPDGLEAGLTPRELRDLIDFLQHPPPEPATP
jgi:putative membrane-bound dehydrogenase-like protein